MAQWLVVVPPDRYAAERLYYHDEVEWAGGPGGVPADGDDVVLAAGDPVEVFGLGRVVVRTPGEDHDPDDPDAPEIGEDTPHVRVRYTHRLLDAPIPLEGFEVRPGVCTQLGEAEYTGIAGRVGPERAVAAPRRSWLVGLELPIEAGSPAEAVRQFWSYVTRLGPRELPAFVSPADDELAMQAYVLGDVANLDPEEDE